MSNVKYSVFFNLKKEASAFIEFKNDKEARSIASTVSRYGKVYNKKFITRRIIKNDTHGVKIWRIE